MAFPQVGVAAVVDGVGSFLRDMGKMDSAIDKTADRADQSGGRIGKVGSKLAGFGKAAGAAALTGVAALGAAIVGIGVVSLKTAVEFESAWAGVVKTTDGLVDEFGNLTEKGAEMQTEFRDLAKVVPIAVEELLGIGELGGQLGVASEDLIGFTEVIAAMGVSTNLSTDEAATGLARLANVMGTTESEGSAAFSKLGSTIVALGNNSATTEADILNFASRMAGAAEVAGVTEADMLGISAAFSSVGIQAQAGGTAVSKVFLGMNKAALEGGEAMEIFAATAGLNADEFGAAWEADAGAVFGEFVKGLGLAGDDAIAILDALEIKDSQAVRAFLSLAGAGDLVTESMTTANKGWDENTALATEAATRYATTESQMILLKNTLKDVGITIGMALLPWLNKLLQAARPLIDEFGKRLPGFLNNVLTPALESLGQFLATALPQALEISRAILMDVYLPALQAVWQFISANVVPILQSLWDWLAVMLPQALALATEFWNTTFLPALQGVWAFIQESLIPAFIAFGEFLVSVLTPIVQAYVDFMIMAFTAVKNWVVENWPLIQETVQTVLTAVQDIVVSAMSAVRSFWEENGAAIMANVAQVWTVIQSLIEAAVTIIAGFITAAMQAINGDWETAWATMQAASEAAMDILKVGIKAAMDVIEVVIGFALDAIEALFALAWEGILLSVDAAIEGIKIIINNGMKAAKTIFEFILGSIESAVAAAWDAIPEIFKTGIEAAKNALTSVVSAFKAAGEAIVTAVGDGIDAAWDGLVSGFKSKLDDLADLLPFSEPKKPSPLRGLGKAGAAIVKNIAVGLANAMPVLQAQLGAAINPVRQSGPVTNFGGNVTNISRDVSIEVISNPASQPSEQAIFFDVSAALAAARGG